ncbi:MAG TPA: hypothetical protein VGD98_03600 [Ktedonobacteraceae bacterium]
MVRVFLLILLTVMVGLVIGPALLESLASGEIRFPPWAALFGMLLYIPLFLFVIGCSLRVERRWKSIETLRLASAQGDYRLLARTQPQPQPNSEAVVVPVTIGMRYSRRTLLVFALFLLPFVIGLVDAGFLFALWLEHLLNASTWLWLLSPREETYLRFDFQRASVELTALYSYTNQNWRFCPQPAQDAAILAHWQALTQDWPSSHGAQARQLLDSLDQQTRPLASTADVRPTLECITAIYKSAATRSIVQQGTIREGDPFYEHVAGHAARASGQ